MIRGYLMTAAALVAVGSLAGPASAQTLFTLSLSGANETPPVVSPGIGTGTATLNATNDLFTFSFNYSDMVAPVTVAHFHNAPAGTPGPVVYDLIASGDGTAGATSGTMSGTWTPAEGLTANLSSLLADGIYVNLHSSTFPGGELRGQWQVVPEPTSFLLVGGVAVGGWWVRRRKVTN